MDRDVLSALVSETANGLELLPYEMFQSRKFAFSLVIFIGIY